VDGAGGVLETAGDLSRVADAEDLGVDGERKAEGGEHAGLEQKAVGSRCI